MRRLHRRLGFLLAATLIFTVSAGAAHADPVKCLAGIGKASAAFAQAKMKLLQKCADKLAKGEAPSGSCSDQKTLDKITKAQGKTDSAIAKACGGKDKACGTGDDDTLVSIGWPSTCMNFESGSCGAAVADCGGISPCLTCIGESAVDQAIGLYYGALEATSSKSKDKAVKALNKCQLAIGKSAAGLFAAKTKALQKCWDTQNKNGAKGKPTVACPPFDAGDGKADGAIAKALAKTDAAICKACGGADKHCDDINDFTPTEIGFPSDCTPVTVPGTSTQACAHAVTTLDELRQCVDCVTEFKADCLTLAGATGFPKAPAYPSECNFAPPATPTRTATPVPTATATPSAVPTATATITGGATPTATLTADPTATSTPHIGGTCPTQITFTGTSTTGVLDTGWTGQGHDATVISEGTVTVSVTSCANAVVPCGVCNYTGPIPNAAGLIPSHRCSLDSSISCTGDGDCTGNGTCKFFFGSYLPLAAGGVSTCVENTFSTGISGTANVETGDSAGAASLTSRVFTGPTLSEPCPQCTDTTPNDGVKGGTCTTGLHAGDPCDANGSSPNIAFGTTSLDCPPLGGGVIASLPIDLSNTTGVKTRTLTSASPNCRAVGFTGLKCQCDTCNNPAATPCSSNADCVSVGATICGGKRCVGGANNGNACTVTSECPGGACTVPGQATAPNQCNDGVCSPDPNTPGPNDGICAGGPFEQFCGPVETFRGCSSNAQCTRPGDTCSVGKNRDCFDSGGLNETVKATGAVDVPSNHQSNPTLAALFCIGPTSSSAVNSAAGLPGLGRLELLGHATDNGTP